MTSSPMPVPVPTTSRAGTPSSALVNAAAAVVLPMPISPRSKASAPSATAWAASVAPAEMAALASLGSMLRSRRMLPVPGRIERRKRLTRGRVGTPDRSPATPTSMSATSAPACRASALIAAPPDMTLATIAAVTCEP
jgi:hypothetical protein